MSARKHVERWWAIAIGEGANARLGQTFGGIAAYKTNKRALQEAKEFREVFVATRVVRVRIEVEP